jgi:hypothetical protein
MKTKLPLILILSGVLIGVIAYFGSQYANRVSDAELIQQTIFEQQAKQAELLDKVLEAPDECRDLSAKFVFDYADMEPDDLVSWPDWKAFANAAEQACILAALHLTNEQSFALGNEEYTRSDPENLSVAKFIADVARASFASDIVEYWDHSASTHTLLTAYYTDRADSPFKPKFHY